jgi:hypothetical protein
MKRGAVVIGVDKYNDSSLPDLQAAVQGAKDVAVWATSNGFEVKPVTDDAGLVTMARVKKAIRDFTSRSGDERLAQLLVYFSGHGFNRGFDEFWLLSEAARDQNEAVNFSSTVDMARYTTGIPHVVFISDACRSAADTIDLQTIVGQLAIVGRQRQGKAGRVDRLYACGPGKPALEVKDSTDPHGTYEALYTSCALDALNGKVAQIVESLQIADPGGLPKTIGVITAESLQSFLQGELPKRVAARKLKRAQDPDGIIESKAPLYLSEVPIPSGEQRVSRGAGSELRTRAAVARWDRAILVHGQHEFELLGRREIVPELEPWRDTFNADSRRILEAIDEDKPSESMEIRVHGAGVRAAQSTAGVCVVCREGNVTRVRLGEKKDGELRPPWRPVSVLVEFDGGRGAAIAALPRYGATLLIDRGELASVTYDPATGGQAENERLRALRASVAAAARHGAFRIEDADARAFADRIRIMKGIDPTLGIYAAYAYHQVGLLDQIQSIARYMRDDLDGHLPFDVAMLLRTPDAQSERLRASAAVPFCPMLTQGWALLPAKRVMLPPSIEAAGRHLARSLWTLFEAEGVRLVRKAMASGELS